IPADAPGFTATLSSYGGEIETDFPLNVESPLQRGAINRRIIGRYGDGQAQIVLDSFSQGVKLSKASAGALKDCKGIVRLGNLKFGHCEEQVPWADPHSASAT